MKKLAISGFTLMLLTSACGSVQRQSSHVSDTEGGAAAKIDQPFPAFEGELSAPLGNHGTLTLELVDQSVLKYTASYNGESSAKTLDLAAPTDDLIELHDFIYSVEQLQEALEYWEKPDQMPQVETVLNYLNNRFAVQMLVAPEVLTLSSTADFGFLRQGTSQQYRVQYAAREAGEVLVELQDAQGKVIARSMVSVPAGLDRVEGQINVPVNAPADQTGFISAKLLNVGGSDEDVRAEVKAKVEYKKAQALVEGNAYVWREEPTEAQFVSSFFCSEACEVLAEIFDAQGQLVSSKTVRADDKPYKENAHHLRFKLEVPTWSGQAYSYVMKLLPAGGKPEQAFDAFRGAVEVY